MAPIRLVWRDVVFVVLVLSARTSCESNSIPCTGDSWLPLRNPQFSDPTYFDIQLHESTRGWWLDGRNSVRLNQGQVELLCGPRATAVYQYVDLGCYARVRTGTLRYALKGTVPRSTGDGRQDFAGFIVQFGSPGEPQIRPILVPFAGAPSEQFRHHQVRVPVPDQVESVIVSMTCTGEPATLGLYIAYVELQLDRENVTTASLGFGPFLDVNVDACPVSQPETPWKPMLARQYAVSSTWHPRSFSASQVVLESGAPPPNATGFALHASIDRWPQLLEQLPCFPGQAELSVAFYSPSQDLMRRFKNRITHDAKRVFRRFGRVAFKFVACVSSYCDGAYPINVLRNMAYEQCESRFVLNLDSDMCPSASVVTSISVHAHLMTGTNASLVLPAFEQVGRIKKSAARKFNKDMLVSTLRRGGIAPFKAQVAPASHGATAYHRWVTATTTYEASYELKYEPYLVVDRTNLHLPTPLFDDRFQGYGWNKVSFVLELFLIGFRFLVLPDSWLIHFSHEKSKVSELFSSSPIARFRNRALVLRSVSEILEKYRVDLGKWDNND